MTERAKTGEGFRVGKLQVISATERRKNGYTIWLCGCLQAKVVVDNMKFVDGTSVTLLEKAGKFELFGDDPKSLYMLDNELGARVYAAPSLVL